MSIVARSHGGDAGGNDRPRGRSRGPTGGSQGSGGGKRGRDKTTLAAFRKMWRDNGKKLLPIEFDEIDGQTWKPVGTYSNQFIRTISLKIGDGNKIPFYFESWKHVEPEFKTGIWPEIKTYFDMAAHLTGPNAKHVEDAVDAICQECYKGHKHRFKKYEFLKKDGYKDPDALRRNPPGNMPNDIWNKHIDFFLKPAQMKKSETNSKNRSKQPYPSLQGTKSLAASRHARRKKGIDGNPDEYPSRIEDFGLMHKKKKTGAYVNDVAATNHKALEDAKKTTQESGENVSEIDILAKVLGTRSGHTRSVGRKLKGASSISSATSSSSSYYGASKTYTQEEVNKLFVEQGKSMKKAIRKKVAASFNKKLENMLTQLAEKGISLDKDNVVGEEDEEYEESDDEGMEDGDEIEGESEGIDENDHDQ